MDIVQIQEFLGNHPLLTGALLVVFVMIIGNEINRLRRGYKELAPADAVQLLNKADAQAIDLRTANEFLAGHIIGAKNISLAKLLEAPLDLGLNQQAPVIAYCGNGQNGARAASALAKAGYQQVSMLRGGLTAWQADRFPLESKQKKGEGKKKKKQKQAQQEAA